MSIPFNFSGVPLYLKCIRVHGIPSVEVGGGCTPFFVINHGRTRLYESRPKDSSPQTFRAKDEVMEWRLRLPVSGDCRIQFFQYNLLRSDEKLFHFHFNTSFIGTSSSPAGAQYRLDLSKSELDQALKDKECKVFAEAFRVELLFDPFLEELIDGRPVQPLAVFDE